MPVKTIISWPLLAKYFAKSFILKVSGQKYCVTINIFIRLKDAHKGEEDHVIREFCNTYIEEFRAHNKSLQRGSDMSRYPNVGEAELFYFMNFEKICIGNYTHFTSCSVL